MADKPEPLRFEGDGLLSYIKERSDDIEKVVIVTGDLRATGPQGHVVAFPGVGMLLHMLDGREAMISKHDAEQVLNDGILTRMRIKIELMG